MPDMIREIVVVGGGTAGWLTAGTIAARHQGRMKSGFKVTLIESPDIKIIGVGEGTWPTMRTTLGDRSVSSLRRGLQAGRALCPLDHRRRR
jgi:tryptophan halogenase